ncbi:MAG TPA: hypothetical protein VNW99_02635, partial [Cytophagaceae bacterium]|nr:hypothetical protein [Cytophagaceae bacterium]
MVFLQSLLRIVLSLLFYITIDFNICSGATFIVDNTTDIDPATAYVAGDGTNSLRKCIRLADAAAGADIINFNLPGPAYLITLVSALPAITSPVTIN